MITAWLFMHTGFAPLVGPIVISCKHGTDPELREVFWEVKEDGVVGGTTDGEKASRFYLDDKGNGRFCIHYYGKTVDVQFEDCNCRRLYVKRSKLPNADIRVAVSNWEYDEKQDLLFEITTRYRVSDPYSVHDWQRKRDMVYLSVSKNQFLRWGKKAFYIQMNISDGATPPKFALSLVSAGTIVQCNSSLQQVFFCSRPPTTVSQSSVGSSSSATPTGATHAVAPQPNTGGTGPPISSGTVSTAV